jgi:circadian clock protein KaiB
MTTANTYIPASPPDVIYLFRLYVVGTAPNSIRAVANLRAICQKHLFDRFELEIIDILDNPLRALADDVLLTPTLVKLEPPPVTRLIGNLNDHSSVLSALGIVTGY